MMKTLNSKKKLSFTRPSFEAWTLSAVVFLFLPAWPWLLEFLLSDLLSLSLSSVLGLGAGLLLQLPIFIISGVLFYGVMSYAKEGKWQKTLADMAEFLNILRHKYATNPVFVYFYNIGRKLVQNILRLRYGVQQHKARLSDEESNNLQMLNQFRSVDTLFNSMELISDFKFKEWLPEILTALALGLFSAGILSVLGIAVLPWISYLATQLPMLILSLPFHALSVYGSAGILGGVFAIAAFSVTAFGVQYLYEISTHDLKAALERYDASSDVKILKPSTFSDALYKEIESILKIVLKPISKLYLLNTLKFNFWYAVGYSYLIILSLEQQIIELCFTQTFKNNYESCKNTFLHHAGFINHTDLGQPLCQSLYAQGVDLMRPGLEPLCFGQVKSCSDNSSRLQNLRKNSPLSFRYA